MNRAQRRQINVADQIKDVERITDDELRLLKEAQQQATMARVPFDFLVQQISRRYQTGERDTIDIDTGVITRVPVQQIPPPPGWGDALAQTATEAGRSNGHADLALVD